MFWCDLSLYPNCELGYLQLLEQSLASLWLGMLKQLLLLGEGVEQKDLRGTQSTKCGDKQSHRVCIAPWVSLLHFTILERQLWWVIGEKLEDKGVVREVVDQQEDDVDDGEGGAGEECAVFPGAPG